MAFNAPIPDPTNAPTVTPVAPPVAAATIPPDAGCTCEEGVHEPLTFKCGKHVYVCPELYENGVQIKICQNTGATNSIYYGMNAAECLAMQAVEIGDKCIALPAHEISQPKSLSNRVCYHDEGYGFKVENADGTGCEECTGFLENPTVVPP